MDVFFDGDQVGCYDIGDGPACGMMFVSLQERCLNFEELTLVVYQEEGKPVEHQLESGHILLVAGFLNELYEFFDGDSIAVITVKKEGVVGRK